MTRGQGGGPGLGKRAFADTPDRRVRLGAETASSCSIYPSQESVSEILDDTPAKWDPAGAGRPAFTQAGRAASQRYASGSAHW